MGFIVYVSCIDGNGESRIIGIPEWGDSTPTSFPNAYYSDMASLIEASGESMLSSLTYICGNPQQKEFLLQFGFTDVLSATEIGHRLTLSNGNYIVYEPQSAMTANLVSTFYKSDGSVIWSDAYAMHVKSFPSFSQTLREGQTPAYVCAGVNIHLAGSSYDVRCGSSFILPVFSGTRLENGAIWWNEVQPTPTPPAPSGDDPDPYEEAGGGADPLPGSEIIGLPNEPALSPIDAGLFTLYSPTAAQMRNLADFLWTDFGGTGTTVEQVLEEVVEALKRSVSNPLNSMLGLSIIASQGLSKGSDSSVRVGFWNTGVSMTKLTKQYFTVDCGSLSFSPVCGNTFLDYAPYSKFMIYLPYVGMRLLDANDVVGHTISIRYRGDCVSGALTCYVIRDGSVIQEHTGSCALNIPLTADSWAESISAVGRIISGSVSGATRGGVGGAAAGAVRGAASVATNPSAFSSQVAHTGAVSGAAGHLGSQKPFILREAVRFHSTDGFNSIIGYPSYYYRKLGDCRGYTQCLEVHLNHTPCTGVELQEIEELLKKGVII